MMAIRHMGNSRTLWWIVIVVIGIAMIYGGGQLAGAHQFAVQNRLNDSLLVDCQSPYRSNGEQELWSGKRYVFAWFEKPPRPEDWVCGFSWLGTTYVKKFAVYNHTQIAGGGLVCDICEWMVNPSGFFIKGEVNKNQTGFHFMYEWDASCLSSSL